VTATEQAASIAANCQQARQIGDRWQCLCPSHDDIQASLTITAKDDRVLIHCHAGCSTSSILQALNLTERDLFVTSNGHTPTQKRRIVARYSYENAAGSLLFNAARFEPKGFAQYRPDPANPGQWIWNLDGIEPVLYHLPQVLTAVQTGETVYVVEGEKDADNLCALGLVATCNPMGAGKWRDSYSEALRGAHVVILPDNDAPGQGHAAQVARSLQGKASRITLIDLPGLPPKGDVSDWLRQGHTRGELEALVQAAP